MAIPGLKNIDHFGFTVPDLQQAVAFFEKFFAFKRLYEFGPFAADDNWMADHLNVDPRAKIEKIAVMTAGNILLEIFEYVATETQNSGSPKNSDIGGHHLAFYVEDIDAAVKYLTDEGLTVLGAPTTMTDGPTAGETWVYFLAPWGMQLELVSYPNGKAYARQGTTPEQP